jgi:anthranilate 1,2-dioxygenase small subunit
MDEAALHFLVARLNGRYAAAIDEDRLEDWPAFFAADGRYKIITRENHERGLPVGILYAASRAMLEDRVASLREANIYAAQHYRHILSPPLVLGEADGTVTAQTNYQVIRILEDGAMTLFSVGRYLDRIALAGARPLFAEKLVICDSRRIDTLLALPL